MTTSHLQVVYASRALNCTRGVFRVFEGSICCFFFYQLQTKKTKQNKNLWNNSVSPLPFLKFTLSSLLFPPMVLFLLSLLTRNTFLSFPPPTSYYRALLVSVFMSQNCSSVSLSNFPYHSEKPSADLCHLYGDTYQSAAAASSTHSAVYKIIMDLVRCGNIQFFSAVNLFNTAVAETKTWWTGDGLAYVTLIKH